MASITKKLIFTGEEQPLMAGIEACARSQGWTAQIYDAEGELIDNPETAEEVVRVWVGIMVKEQALFQLKREASEQIDSAFAPAFSSIVLSVE